MESNRLTVEGTWSRDSRFKRDAQVANLEFVEPVRSFLVAHAVGAGKLIELGALPGAIGAHLAATLNAEFVGVDYVDRREIFDKTCAAFGVRKFRFVCEDVFKLRVDEPFDIVTSFGLVEHFQDPSALFAIHRRLCASGGYVVITVPNFRGWARCYHALFNRPTYREHNLSVMRSENMMRYAEQGGLHVVECRYVGNHRVWGINANLPLPLRLTGAMVQSLHNYLGRKLSLRGAFFSPWLICIAKVNSAPTNIHPARPAAVEGTSPRL
jgi:2-polyprenyl-3-methyl-5-hydroxy-6-metoxy-1,4-benzoquinol methylase